ncbi:MAG: dehydrogenase E1 component subunit alpha/beta, partial [Planctomycetes bacterium]|nr:dehydrogenase E1 component subunit alpha/beta [Planctomycetota bacterium]
LARGADLKRMMAELFGRRDGYSLGVGGSQHMAAAEVGFLGSNGISGGGLPIAVGAGLAQKLAVCAEPAGAVLAFLGDGASAQGTFHESVNLAEIWKLPVIFLVENNQYAMGTPVEETCPDGKIARRAQGYGIPGVSIDGNDPLAVEAAVREARTRAVGGKGPTLIEAITYRATGHSRSDQRDYITEDEIDSWNERDPITTIENKLLAAGGKQEDFDALLAELCREMDEAAEIARQGALLSPGEYYKLPQNKLQPATLPKLDKTQAEAKDCTYADAIYQALARALSDPAVILLGEDIAEYGGAFKITRDLWERFGKQRVRNTPISENTIVGCGTGAAMTGLRPVVEIMFMDFLLLAMDQLVNHAAKFGSIYGGQFPVPLTVRTPAGARRGYGATHSQCFEAMLMNIPGLKIFCPATVQDAYDLLLAAIYDNDPVVVVEHKLLYGTEGRLNPAAEPLPPGKARILRPGKDLTIITFSHMTTLAMQAAEKLEEAGISAEVIDLRTLAPLDLETITNSAVRTQHVLIAEEGTRCGGVGAELAARIQESCFGYLDAPILRVAARDLPLPATQHLETAALPQVEDFILASRKLLAE